MNQPIAVALSFLLSLAACESEPSPSDPAAEAAGDPLPVTRPAAAGGAGARIDLEATGAAIRDGKVKTANDLEASINREPTNRVDVDADGRPDQLQVVEDPQARRRRFQVRALPSSKKGSKPEAVAVPVASIDVEPAGERARVSLRHVHDEVGVVVIDAPIIVGSFCHWVLIVERPVFIGATYVVVHEVHYKHKKFKHKKFKYKKR